MAVDDANTIVLLHFNGVDGGTTFTDESGRTWTHSTGGLTAPEIDTAQSVFGGASGLFAVDVPTTKDIITTDVTADIAALGSSDWTIDFRFRFSGVQHDGIMQIGTVDGHTITITYLNLTGLQVKFGSVTSTFSWTPSNTTWYHLAFVHSQAGQTIKAYVDGVLLSSQINAGAPTIANTVAIGFCAIPNNGFDGWMDELRISNIQRWTENFSLPTYEYGNEPKTIAATLTIEPQMSGTMDRPGVDATLQIDIQMSGTILGPVTLDGTMEIPIEFSGTALHIPPPVEMNGSLPITIQMSGTMGSYPVYDVRGYVVLPALTIEGSGRDSCIATGDIRMPSLSISGVGRLSCIGTGSVRIPLLRLSAEGGVSCVGTVNISLPVLQVTSEGVVNSRVAGTILLPALKVTASGYSSIEGTATITLPGLVIRGYSVPDSYLNMVLNIKNRALTVYDNYDFNSMCRFNDVNLGATSAGIFDLDTGETDNGTEIEWNFRTAYLDQEAKSRVKIDRVRVGYKSNSDIVVTAILPNGEEYEYSLDGVYETETGLTVKFGRGIRSRYVAVDVRSQDGSTINLDSLKLELVKLLR